mgnify:CR=1 FL=1
MRRSTAPLRLRPLFLTLPVALTATHGNAEPSYELPTIAVDNNGASTNLDMNIGIDVGTSGLLVHVIQLGSASGGIDLTLKDVAIGSAGAPKMGNFNIVGLNLATAWVRIDGHL